MTTFAIVVTCEHGGNRVPAAHRHLFRGRRRILESHRGHDPGALDMARYLSRRIGAPLERTTVTRLLVDLNRSIGHPSLFSEWSRALPNDERADILRRYYYPHRERVEVRIAKLIARGRTVLHVASHTFTPVLDGQVRNADVAWLYDPRRSHERRLCSRWREALSRREPELRLRRNYPYRGVNDGFMTHLRRTFSPTRYLGVELEVNQKWFAGELDPWRRLRRSIAEALVSVTAEKLR